LGWTNGLKAFESMLYKGTPGSQDVHELFWGAGTAHRPESASDTSRHDHTIQVFIHFKKVYFAFCSFYVF
jgi:hypothetical protein